MLQLFLKGSYQEPKNRGMPLPLCAVTWSNGQETALLRNPTELQPAPPSNLPCTQHTSEHIRKSGLDFKGEQIPYTHKAHTSKFSAQEAAELTKATDIHLAMSCL